MDAYDCPFCEDINVLRGMCDEASKLTEKCQPEDIRKLFQQHWDTQLRGDAIRIQKQLRCALVSAETQVGTSANPVRGLLTWLANVSSELSIDKVHLLNDSFERMYKDVYHILTLHIISQNVKLASGNAVYIVSAMERLFIIDLSEMKVLHQMRKTEVEVGVEKDQSAYLLKGNMLFYMSDGRHVHYTDIYLLDKEVKTTMICHRPDLPEFLYFGGTLYVVGGLWEGNGFEKCDIASGKWSLLPDFDLSMKTCTSYDDRYIYVAGYTSGVGRDYNPEYDCDTIVVKVLDTLDVEAGWKTVEFRYYYWVRDMMQSSPSNVLLVSDDFDDLDKCSDSLLCVYRKDYKTWKKTYRYCLKKPSYDIRKLPLCCSYPFFTLPITTPKFTFVKIIAANGHYYFIKMESGVLLYLAEGSFKNPSSYCEKMIFADMHHISSYNGHVQEQLLNYDPGLL